MRSSWRISLAILAALSASIAVADDFKTTSGKEYKAAKVSRVEPDGIVISFSGGIVKIPFTELSPEIQKKFGYDPQAAATYSAEQSEQQAALAQQRKADEQRRFEERQKLGGQNPPSTQVQSEPNSVASSQNSNIIDPGPCPIPNATFLGRVVSVVNSGEAVLTVEPSQYFGLTPTPGSTVYVYAQFGNVVDGDWFKVMGACVGRVQYHTTAGAIATVYGYRGRVTPTPEGRTY